MKFLHINGDDSYEVSEKLETVCLRLEKEGYKIVNCQYVNSRHIVAFYNTK